MEFGEKFNRAFNKIRGKLIVAVILWLILVIVFVAPMGVALHQVNSNQGDPVKLMVESLGEPLNSYQNSLLPLYLLYQISHFVFLFQY